MLRRLCAAPFGLSAVIAPGASHAQAPLAWPTRPVRFIVPFGPGTAVDVGARMLGDKLAEPWRQPIVVDNRPGGDGILAMTAFLNANDDHVLMYCATGSYAVHPWQLDVMSYDFRRDLAPVARIANTILAAAAPASMKLGSLREFVDLARANPGKLNAAVVQGITELVFDGFVKAEGVVIEKVPYKDIVQAVPDLIEGRINLIFSSYATVRPAVAGGSVKVLAVSARERTASLPDIPTVREAGVPSLELEGLSGVFGPAKMSLAVRQRAGADIVAAMDATVLARLAASGQTPAPGGPDDLDQALRRQIAQVDAVASLLGMKRKQPR